MWIVIAWLAGVAVGWLAASRMLGVLVRAMEEITASTLAVIHQGDAALGSATASRALQVSVAQERPRNIPTQRQTAGPRSPGSPMSMHSGW